VGKQADDLQRSYEKMSLVSKVTAAMPQAFFRHEHSFLTLEQTSADRRFMMPFMKTYDYQGYFINESHQRLALARCHDNSEMINLGIEGWLPKAEVLKLYEIAYFCPGDIIELGTYKGLSTSILAEASADSGRVFEIITVDLDPSYSLAAREGMMARNAPGRANVHFFTFDAIQFVENQIGAGRTYHMAFVDHSHEYSRVYDTCVNLHHLLEPEAFVIFHDYNEPRNAAKDAADYGVFQAVQDGLSKEHFDFWGIYGSCGLFRKKTG
jgi:predicted O-methyltransferase YrrM